MQGRVLVIGAGLTELVFALAAARRGCKVSVFERNPGLSAQRQKLPSADVWQLLGVADAPDTASMRAELVQHLRASPGCEIVFDTDVVNVQHVEGGVAMELSGARKMYGTYIFPGAADVQQAWALAQTL